MKEIKLKGTKITLYDSIEDLPVKNYNLFNEYSLQDNQIGSTMQDVTVRFEKFDKFLMAKDFDSLLQERKNLQQTFYNMIGKVNFPSLQFACLIHSINGKRIFDYSQENLQKEIDKLSDLGLTQKTVRTEGSSLKKKFAGILSYVFRRNSRTQGG
jgi:hypothetical protein